MEYNCNKCNTSYKASFEWNATYFGCPKCRVLYKALSSAVEDKFDYKPLDFLLNIGSKANIDGIDYEVLNVIIKKFHAIYYWREYTLLSKKGDRLYLSESDGHWILLQELENADQISTQGSKLQFDDLTFDIFERTECRIVSGYGFFEEKIFERSINLTEYINPPYIVSIERMDQQKTVFYGRHFSRKEMKKAFNNPQLPSRSGVGAVQPYKFHFHNSAIFFCVIALLILFSQLYFNQNRTETEVLRKTFEFAVDDNKEFVSESFELKGASSPMTVKINADINNSWANAQISLVDESTNGEEFASRDLEYYHGYTDGESWSEGSPESKFHICGVSEGKYHLVVVPVREPNQLITQKMNMVVTWQKPTLWNFFMCVLLMGLALIGIYFGNRLFESNRWSNNDFSPFRS